MYHSEFIQSEDDILVQLFTCRGGLWSGKLCKTAWPRRLAHKPAQTEISAIWVEISQTTAPYWFFNMKHSIVFTLYIYNSEIYSMYTLKLLIVLCSDVRASSFQAWGGLEPAFFWDFGLWVGSGSAKFASDWRAGGYLCTYKNLKL